MGTVSLLATASVLVVLAGIFSAVDAALASFSHARAEEIREQGRAGSARLLQILGDPARYINTALFLRMLCEVAAIVLVTLHLHDLFDGSFAAAVGTAVPVMLVVSFVVVGVGPRTLGRQHDERMALLLAPALVGFARVLGPLPRLLILVGNAITPGKGYREGPFATTTELREMVDFAEASAVIEAEERKMIHSVFDLGDTTAREVMVPRTDVVYIENYKNLRQARSLFLRSGFSRVPVIGENLDDIVGFAYLKDVARRDFEDSRAETTERIDTVMRPAHFVPDSKPVDDLLKEMQARRQHIAVVVDEYGGTTGVVTIEDILEEIVGEITDEYDEESEAERLPGGPVRVSSRFSINDLDDLVGVEIEDEDVDSVGGLMAKHLGKVPIPGSVVEVDGLRLQAEEPTGRRNRIGTVLISIPEPASDEAEPVGEDGTGTGPDGAGHDGAGQDGDGQGPAGSDRPHYAERHA